MPTMWSEYEKATSVERNLLRLIEQIVSDGITDIEKPNVNENSPSMRNKGNDYLMNKLSSWSKEVSDHVKGRMAKEIQAYLRKNYEPENLPVTMMQILHIHADSERKLEFDGHTEDRFSYYFHYFGDSYATDIKPDGKYIKYRSSQYEQGDVNQSVGITIYPKLKYKNYYRNDDVLFDKRINTFKKQIAEAQKYITTAQNNVTKAKKEADSFSFGTCLYVIFDALIKFAVALVVGGGVGYLATYLCDQIGMDLQTKMIAGIIAGIITVIVIFIKWNIGSFVSSFRTRSYKKAEYKRSLVALERAKNKVKEIENSKEYKEAKANDARLRKEDMAFAEEWHKIWFERMENSPLAFHYSESCSKSLHLTMVEADRENARKTAKAFEELSKMSAEEIAEKFDFVKKKNKGNDGD